MTMKIIKFEDISLPDHVSSFDETYSFLTKDTSNSKTTNLKVEKIDTGLKFIGLRHFILPAGYFTSEIVGKVFGIVKSDGEVKIKTIVSLEDSGGYFHGKEVTIIKNGVVSGQISYTIIEPEKSGYFWDGIKEKSYAVLEDKFVTTIKERRTRSFGRKSYGLNCMKDLYDKL